MESGPWGSCPCKCCVAMRAYESKMGGQISASHNHLSDAGVDDIRPIQARVKLLCLLYKEALLKIDKFNLYQKIE